MARVSYTYMYVVTDAAGAVVATYRNQRDTEAHAERIGGKWSKARY